jgi:hypothetical protein
MSRGSKSAVSLAVVPPALPGERPALPAVLDDTEAGIWWAIAGSMLPPSRCWPDRFPTIPNRAFHFGQEK